MGEPIIAVATPVGESALAVIRLSGTGSIEIVDKAFEGRGRLGDKRTHTLSYGRIKNPETSEMLDEAVVSVYRAPKSYTGEDMAEISCHGNPGIVKEIIEALIKQGARSANPGEFSERAYLSGRLDLIEAEAVNDLIRAHTRFSRESAKSALSGRLSERLDSLGGRLLDELALLEAAIDHSDLDEVFYRPEAMALRIENIINDCHSLIKTAPFGEMTRSGMKVAIVGAPNTGKSSLFNLLLSADRAIVTEIAGTTRDVISEELDIRGISVRLLDTAGIRDTGDKIEAIGIDKSRKAIDEANLCVLLIDGSRALNAQDISVLESLSEKKKHIVINKADLPSALTQDDTALLGADTIRLSSVTGEGLSLLEAAIERFYFSFGVDPKNDVFVTNLRQENCLKEAEAALTLSLEGLKTGLSEEILARHLRTARSKIEEITGATGDDAILNRIFSAFCIGK